MILTRTIKVKIDISVEEILPTVKAYTDSFNHVCKTGWNDKDFNGISLHQKTYQFCKQTLPSQLACSSRVKAVEALKSAKELKIKGKKVSCPQSESVSIRYDHNSYNVWLDKNELSLLTVAGRKRFSFSVPECYKQYLDWRRKSAELFIRRNKVFLNMVFEKETDDIKPTTNVVGVDRGIKKIAVVSNKTFYGGGNVKRIVYKTGRLRAALQNKGTKSAKRHLQKLAKKENRFRKDQNHCIAKKIVNSVPEGTTIVLEDLTNIRDSSKKFRKEQRYWLNSWGFFQLETFLKYKAEGHKCIVDYVDARYTSQKCSKCGHIERGNRTKQSLFKCRQCGHKLNADLNASFNISKNYQDGL
jgi:putative transposase